jgi:hypothetical protein
VAVSVDQRVVGQRDQPVQAGIGPAQQRAQVVVLAEECVEAAAHRQSRAVRGLGPPGHPSTQLRLALEDRDPRPALDKPGGGGKPGDPAADDDGTWLPAQPAGVRRSGQRGMADGAAVPGPHRAHWPASGAGLARARSSVSSPAALTFALVRARGLPCRSHSSSAVVTSANPNKKSSSGMSSGPRSPVTCLDEYSTTGADNLVSQPSTGIWAARTITMDTQ